jgi:hypothetical protein
MAKQQISGLAVNSCIWPSADQSLNSRSIPSMLLNAVWLVVEPPISKTFGTLNPKSHEDYIRTLKTYSVKTKQLSQLFVCSLLPLLDLRHEFPSSALKCKLEIHCRGMPHSCAVEKMIHYGRIWSQNRAPPNFMAQKHHHYFMAIPGCYFQKHPIFTVASAMIKAHRSNLRPWLWMFISNGSCSVIFIAESNPPKKTSS